MSWQAQFADTTTNIAFNLKLTKAQVAAMRVAYLYDQGKETYQAQEHVRSLMGIDQSIPAMKALQSKGLVTHHNAGANRPQDHRWFTLTPAGILVYDMLALAGLVQPRLVDVIEDAA